MVSLKSQAHLSTSIHCVNVTFSIRFSSNDFFRIYLTSILGHSFIKHSIDGGLHNIFAMQCLSVIHWLMAPVLCFDVAYHTQTAWVPVDPANKQCLGRSSANFVKSILIKGNSLLIRAYTCLRLHKISLFETLVNYGDTVLNSWHSSTKLIIFIEVTDFLNNFFWQAFTRFRIWAF